MVAADGTHSHIREELNIQMQGVPTLGTYLTLYAHADSFLWLGEKPAVVYRRLDTISHL